MLEDSSNKKVIAVVLVVARKQHSYAALENVSLINKKHIHSGVKSQKLK
jgi:hypothetical protein